MKLLSQKQLITAYEDACEAELQAFKPGNVSVYADGHDMTVKDFRVSAQVSSKAISNPRYTLGEKIYYAVKATRAAVGCNTNLGIILLCAPMLHAANRLQAQQSFRDVLSQVLDTSTIEDAAWAFKAIALASPGGLGEADEQDIRAKPQVTLTRAMQMSAEKDKIASQYTTYYKDIYDFAILRYNDAFCRWGGSNWAVVAVYAALLRQFPDSHIERKFGKKYTRMVIARMTQVDDELSKTDTPELLVNMLYGIDKEFKAVGVNPGTTADLTVATVLAANLGQLINSGNSA